MEQMQTEQATCGAAFLSTGIWPDWLIYDDDPAAEFEPVPTVSAPFEGPGQRV